MTPAEYLEGVVLPTFIEFAGSPADRRRAYLACLTAAHLVDYVSHATGFSVESVRKRISAHGYFARDALEIVTGIGNGTKHAHSNRGKFHFTPGDERRHEPFSFGTEGSGFGEGRWSQPHLSVSHLDPDDRERQEKRPDRPKGDYCVPVFPIDGCVRGVIWAFTEVFPLLFFYVDLSGTKQVDEGGV